MTTKTRDLDLNADIIDLRDVTDRVDTLRAERDAYDEDAETPGAWALSLEHEDAAELSTLEALLDECRGNGGDHQWEGDWYPGSLIDDAYFETYARDLAEDCGMVKTDDEWPNRHIDWKAAAEELQQDYTSIEVNGRPYWTR